MRSSSRMFTRYEKAAADQVSLLLVFSLSLSLSLSLCVFEPVKRFRGSLPREVLKRKQHHVRHIAELEPVGVTVV